MPKITCPDWKAVAFTNEEIKYAIYDGYNQLKGLFFIYLLLFFFKVFM